MGAQAFPQYWNDKLNGLLSLLDYNRYFLDTRSEKQPELLSSFYTAFFYNYYYPAAYTKTTNYLQCHEITNDNVNRTARRRARSREEEEKGELMWQLLVTRLGLWLKTFILSQCKHSARRYVRVLFLFWCNVWRGDGWECATRWARLPLCFLSERHVSDRRLSLVPSAVALLLLCPPAARCCLRVACCFLPRGGGRVTQGEERWRRLTRAWSWTWWTASLESVCSPCPSASNRWVPCSCGAYLDGMWAGATAVATDIIYSAVEEAFSSLSSCCQLGS